MSKITGPALALALVGAVLPHSAAAQAAISVSAGAATYDLSGVGTSGIAAVRGELPLAPALDFQFGTGFFWYGSQFDNQIAMLLHEAGVLARVPVGIPLLLGAGVGHTLGVKGNQEDDPTLYVAAGLELEDRAGWAVRPELRVRMVDPWVGTIADFTIGVRRSFGG